MTDTDPQTLTTLRTDQCPSLSARSTLTYELGKDAEGGLHLRVTHNTGKGHHNPSWVAYDTLEPLLTQAQSLSASALSGVFAGTSINTAGFVMAVLKHLGIVQAVEDKRHAYRYVEGEGNDWRAQLQAPMEPKRPANEDKQRGKRVKATATS